MRMLLAAALFVTNLAPALVPSSAFAEPPPPKVAEAPETKDAKLVPTIRDGEFVGLKVYAIKAGGRFDQPTARFAAGDLIEQIDGVAVTTEAGTHALYDKVILGQSDATVTVRRQGNLVNLSSRAKS